MEIGVDGVLMQDARRHVVSEYKADVVLATTLHLAMVDPVVLDHPFKVDVAI